MKVNIRESARTPSYEGTEETSWADVDKSFGAYLKGYYQHAGVEAPDEMPSTVADAPSAAKTWIASKTLLGDAGAEETRDLLFFPVVNPGTNKLNAGALRAVLGGRGSAAEIPAAAKESAQAKARSLLDKEFKSEEEVSAQVAQRDAWWKELFLTLWRGGAPRQTDVEPYRPALNEESLDEAMRKVREAWYATQAQPEVVDEPASQWIREIFEDRIIVESGDKLLAVPYTRSEDGVEFGEAVEVEVQYVEKPAPGGEPAETGEVMNMEQLEMVANRYGLAVQDLEGMAENVVAALAGYQPEPEPCQEYTALIEYADEHGGAESTLAVLREVVAERERAFNELVANLVANEACAFSEDELRAFSAETLGRLVQMFRPANYSGMPVAGTSSSEDREYELPPAG